MVTNANPTEWLREQIAMESEGERTPAQPPMRMVRIADTWVTPETAAEFLAEVA
jgi:hypothetical protein